MSPLDHPEQSKIGGWETVIGLEIHAPLQTQSKSFSGSADRTCAFLT